MAYFGFTRSFGNNRRRCDVHALISRGATLLSLGLIFILYTMFVWWRDVLRESTFEGHHTKVVQLGPRYGFILFIVSEVMFFFALFRASSHSSLAPTVEIGGTLFSIICGIRQYLGHLTKEHHVGFEAAAWYWHFVDVVRLFHLSLSIGGRTWTPRICMQDEPTGVPINRATRFENKVGSLDLVAGESLIKEQILERFFIDLVAGESLIKERAAARFNDLVDLQM
nr:Cytochrome c oxidase subunit 3 [Ipomoea trifida]